MQVQINLYFMKTPFLTLLIKTIPQNYRMFPPAGLMLDWKGNKILLPATPVLTNWHLSIYLTQICYNSNSLIFSVQTFEFNQYVILLSTGKQTSILTENVGGSFACFLLP